MPKLLPPGAEHFIKAFSREGFSQTLIVDKLKKMGMTISQRTVSNVINSIGQQRKAQEEGQKNITFKRQRKVRTKKLIRKVKNKVNKENPPTQLSIANEFKVSQRTIFRIIHEDLKLKTRRKTKVHSLNDRHKQIRKTNCRKLYEDHLAADKWKYVVSLDETWVYLNNCDRQTKICYVKPGEKDYEKWLCRCAESFPKGFMLVGIITGKGTLPLIKVPSNVKIDAEYYVNFVLKPIIEKLIPSLYGDETNKVWIHHDAATSHTSKKTQEYLQEASRKFGINFIKNSEIPIKAPDASIVDFLVSDI